MSAVQRIFASKCGTLLNLVKAFTSKCVLLGIRFFGTEREWRLFLQATPPFHEGHLFQHSRGDHRREWSLKRRRKCQPGRGRRHEDHEHKVNWLIQLEINVIILFVLFVIGELEESRIHRWLWSIILVAPTIEEFHTEQQPSVEIIFLSIS